MKKLILTIAISILSFTSSYSQVNSDTSIIYYEGKSYAVLPNGNIIPYTPPKISKLAEETSPLYQSMMDPSTGDLLIQSGELQLKSVRTSIQGRLIGFGIVLVGVATLQPAIIYMGGAVALGFDIAAFDLKIRGHKKLVQAGLKSNKKSKKI